MGAITGLLILVLQLFSLVVLARVFLSWMPNLDRSNSTVNTIVQTIYDVTEPVLRPIRQQLPATSGMDFSPLVVFLGIYLLTQVIGSL